MTYYVYLIVSKHKKNKIISYVGYTNNLTNRIILHNTNKGAKFTRGRRWKLIFFKKFSSKSKAMKYEYLLKNNYKLRQKIKYENFNTSSI